MYLPPINVAIFLALVSGLWWVRHKRKAEEDALNPSSPKSPKLPKPNASASNAPTAPKPPKPEEPPEVIYQNLRRQAFATTPDLLGVAGMTGEDEPYALVIEMGMAEVITLACFADGDAGLYYQTGGGIRGGYGHDTVRRASKELLALAKGVVPQMEPTADNPYPPFPAEGHVRFYALTPRGLKTVEVAREDLGEDSPFSALFSAGQEVVGQMRRIQTQRGA